MFHKPVSGLAGIVFLLCASIAAGQDFHVDTQIYDLQAKTRGGKPQSVGAAASLFHAGKVYDHSRGLNEMTIYEPAQERFVVLDSGRNLKTIITFQEITDQLLEQRTSAQQYLSDADRLSLPADQLAFFRFQLDPKFKVTFAPRGQGADLSLTSPQVEYQVDCTTAKSPDAVRAYLEYADWAARLSYVTHRQSMLPNVRLAVNEELRRHTVLPVKVTLRTKGPKELHVRAEHTFGWVLNGNDRSTISHWDGKAESSALKTVPWDQFFKLTPQTAKRK